MSNFKEEKGRSMPVSDTNVGSLNLSVSENANEGMNITFYNAKSSCFPPISKTGN